MKYKINLVSHHKEKPLDRMVYFALNYLRYILVVTQLVVIGVFFYRFKVDQEIVDLEDSVSQKQEIVQISQPLVKEAKNIAFKLDQVAEIMYNQRVFTGTIDYLLTIFPEKFFLTNFLINGQIVTIEGHTQDLRVIQSFLARAKKENKFEKIELKNIEKNDKGLGFSFEFSKYKGIKIL